MPLRGGGGGGVRRSMANAIKICFGNPSQMRTAAIEEKCLPLMMIKIFKIMVLGTKMASNCDDGEVICDCDS